MDAHGFEAKETIPASRKLGRAEAGALAKAASKVIVAKGKKVEEHPGGSARKAVVDAMLGPTGNLRAPTVRAGKTVLIGFDEATWAKALL
ncbi:MAG TPA: ArsC family (seleno)protein [Myxococcota bacterium]|nr:ArsC family (seleno)protein [Myxococcota bacterium]